MGEVNQFLGNAMDFIANRADITPEMADYLDSIGLDKSVAAPMLIVMEAALLTHQERDGEYGDAWKEFGAAGNAFNLARKGKRAWRSLFRRNKNVDGRPGGCDDAMDSINYACFTIICAAEGNLDG